MWDNTAEPRVVFSDATGQGTRQGTQADQLITTPDYLYADGARGELLDVELKDVTAATPVTASHVVRIQVAKIYVQDGALIVEEDTLATADRLTQGTAGTAVDAATGWPDNQPTVARQFGTMLRFRPQFGMRYMPRGIQYVYIEGA